MSEYPRFLLAEHTTLGVGGPAAHWREARTHVEIQAALAWASERGLSTVVLGGGSNVLAADRGIDGLVLRLRNAKLQASRAGDGARITVGAGMNWDAFVAWTVAEGFSGLECLSGIPGEVGAAPLQNIGAYGQEAGRVIRRVEVVDRATGATEELSQEACEFGYRESIFKTKLAERFIVVEVEFELSKGPALVAYGELERALENEPEPSLLRVRETVLNLRRAKSMLLDPSDPNGRSAGSFFVNPGVSHHEADAVEERARALAVHAPMPRFTQGAKQKLSAGWLIEHSGLTKGTRRGQVGLSTKHCLAVVNHGGATAEEIVKFATEIRQRVRDTFGVTLTPEPRPLGFLPGELAALYD